MMKDFVPYKIAVELKQLGFNEPCIKGFYNKQEIFTTVSSPIDFNNKKQLGELVSSPTFSQSFRFFRKNGYNSHIEIEEFNLNTYSYKITVFDKYSIGNVFNSYEETELECLKKLIKIIKK